MFDAGYKAFIRSSTWTYLKAKLDNKRKKTYPNDDIKRQGLGQTASLRKRIQHQCDFDATSRPHTETMLMLV